MHLIVDLGNTNSKFALFKEGNILEVFRREEVSYEWLKDLVIENQVTHSILSSVLANNSEIFDLLKSESKCIYLNDETNLPLKMGYKTPETLGNDRLGNAVELHHQFEGENALCIDVGTCVKFDFVDSSGIYKGGSISPGLDMQFKSLNKFTGRLPLIDKEGFGKMIGEDSKESILAGVMAGTVAMIEERIRAFDDRFPGLKIVLTGGDAKFFDIDSKNTIFADPYFTLKGLHTILKYNEIRDI